MLVINGQPPIHASAERAARLQLHRHHTVGMFRHCTRYNSLVSPADQLEIKLIAR